MISNVSWIKIKIKYLSFMIFRFYYIIYIYICYIKRVLYVIFVAISFFFPFFLMYEFNSIYYFVKMISSLKFSIF